MSINDHYRVGLEIFGVMNGLKGYSLIIIMIVSSVYFLLKIFFQIEIKVWLFNLFCDMLYHK